MFELAALRALVDVGVDPRYAVALANERTAYRLLVAGETELIATPSGEGDWAAHVVLPLMPVWMVTWARFKVQVFDLARDVGETGEVGSALAAYAHSIADRQDEVRARRFAA